MFDTITDVADGLVIQAYQFALDPTVEQDDALRSHCGGQRYAYNWGLARIKATLAQREAPRGGLRTARSRTPRVWPTSRPPWATGPTPSVASGPAADSGSPGSRASGLVCRVGRAWRVSIWV